ncbi:hypothetical protein JS578_02530 [Dysgonomonadaceae bacterium zrk40]|nr:hypothetical protein JS578_02530 [Dysgonomonadaceae bacterium zrk40]
MKRGEKVKIYFKRDGRCYKLFNVIQLGKDGEVDLKITGFYNNFVEIAKSTLDDKGYYTVEELEESRIVSHAEMSYHKDGSFLHKINDNPEPEYINPYGQGERWVRTDAIEDFQPILNIAIRRMDIFNKSCLVPTLKSGETSYICENDDFFDETGTYLLILYIRNKKHIVNCFTSAKLYSDVIIELNKDLDLCIFIQRHGFPAAKPYFSKVFNCLITPYLHNSINFCNRENAKDEMKEVLEKSVFDPKCNLFLKDLADNKLFNFSEDKLKLAEQVDILYENNGCKMPISKPLFLKQALNYLGDELSDFNNLDQGIKQLLLEKWNNDLENLIQKE